MEIGVSNRVVHRNGIGQFTRDCSDAAESTVKKAIEEGAQLSRTLAPVGPKEDPRTVHLKDSISTQMFGRTSGEWKSTARHALPIELSAVPHDITGWVSFFWEREGRMWAPGSNIIHHPGNAAQPFLRPAYQVIMGKIMSIARSEYP